MPDPVHAWAAVAPDGRIDLRTVRADEQHVWWLLPNFAGTTNAEEEQQAAYRAGWRVVRVEIRAMEGEGG